MCNYNHMGQSANWYPLVYRTVIRDYNQGDLGSSPHSSTKLPGWHWVGPIFSVQSTSRCCCVAKKGRWTATLCLQSHFPLRAVCALQYRTCWVTELKESWAKWKCCSEQCFLHSNDVNCCLTVFCVRDPALCWNWILFVQSIEEAKKSLGMDLT